MKKFSGLALTVMQNNQQSSVDFTLWMFESKMPFFKEAGVGGWGVRWRCVSEG